MAVLARIVSLRWVLSIVVTVLLVAGLLHLAAEAHELAAVAGRIRWHFLPVALLLSAANVLLAALRFRLILLSLGYRLTFGTCVRAVLASLPAAAVTPSRAGEFVRATYVRRVVPLAEGGGAILAEKMIDGLVLLSFALVGSGLASRWELAGAVGLGIVAGLLAFAWAARGVIPSGLAKLVGPVLSKVAGARRAFVALTGRPSYLVAVVGVSGLAFANAIVLIWFLLRFSQADLALVTVAGSWPLAAAAGLLPLTLGGLGTRDAAFVYLVSHTTGDRTAEVLIATLSYSLVTTWLLALVGLPWLMRAAGAVAGELPRGEPRS